MRRYPELRPALPTNFVKPTKTAKVLTPAIVLTTLGILTVSSIVGIAVAGSDFGLKGIHIGGEKIAQAFLLIAVSAPGRLGSITDFLDAVPSHYTIHWLSSSGGSRQ
jgi:hypothetical protein